jgi:hypothetical protein
MDLSCVKQQDKETNELFASYLGQGKGLDEINQSRTAVSDPSLAPRFAFLSLSGAGCF